VASTPNGGHPVRVECDSSAIDVLLDRNRMRRVISNLLDNAFKYSPPGSPVVVRIELADSPARGVLLHVEDAGVGIPVSELPLIFERYHRGSNVRDSTIGEGIGLASARHLVESHGGRLTASSTEGTGSTFTMWLPRT